MPPSQKPMQNTPELSEDQQHILLRSINWLKGQAQSRFDDGKIGSLGYTKILELLNLLEAKVNGKTISYSNAIECKVVIAKIIDTCSHVAKKMPQLESSDSIPEYRAILNELSNANFDSIPEFKKLAEKLFEFERKLQ
ncbi:hypothetical protein HY570_04115 [Candidatus Micrarchaeota archaeon]|nr:hypothetical protein [Candidatus Micrarchaeota archaeon]